MALDYTLPWSGGSWILQLLDVHEIVRFWHNRRLWAKITKEPSKEFRSERAKETHANSSNRVYVKSNRPIIPVMATVLEPARTLSLHTGIEGTPVLGRLQSSYSHISIQRISKQIIVHMRPINPAPSLWGAWNSQKGTYIYPCADYRIKLVVQTKHTSVVVLAVCFEHQVIAREVSGQ